jgi:predicted nucleic acid-binding protein
MSVYLDASVLVPLFIDDLHTSRAQSFLLGSTPLLVVSDFAAAEFASAVSRRVRMQELGTEEARSAFSLFDRWTSIEARRVTVSTSDIDRASTILRSLALPLRTPDAVNIAISERLDASLATFDRRMADCARALGVAVAAL